VTFIATKRPIGHGHGAPADSFLELEIAWAKSEDPIVFAPNANRDIYSLIAPVLAPQGWTSALHRRAGLCEVLRVLAGDESDWAWQCGRDTTAGRQRPEQMEAGAFQVSYDSRLLGPDLQAFLLARGITDAWSFQSRVKADPVLDLAYTGRLLREEYRRWDGPINRGWIAAQVSPAAVDEFERLLTA